MYASFDIFGIYFGAGFVARNALLGGMLLVAGVGLFCRFSLKYM